MDVAIFVIPLGFEPKTHSLEGCCSIQLSYGTGPFNKECKYKALFFNSRRNTILFSYFCEI